MARSTRTARRDLLVVGLGLVIGLGTPSAAMADLAVAKDVCGTLHTLRLADGTKLCTHGDDDHLLELAQEGVVGRAAEAASNAAPVAPVAEKAVDEVLEVVTSVADAPLVSPHTSPAAGNLASLDADLLSPAPGAVAEAEARQANRTDAAVPSLKPVCVTDGVEGHRVQAIVLDVAGSDIAAATDTQVRRWAGQVDWTFASSAERDGARRNVRWVTRSSGDGCVVDVARLRVSAADVDGFNATVATLREAGFDRNDRKYLAYVNAAQVCGIGTVPVDDRPGFDNASNRTSGYSRIDAPCWDTADTGFYSVAAHELAHNLGAVQASAPNSNGAYHCNDEWDLMCYQQGDNELELVCVDDNSRTEGEGDLNNRLLDCGGDDYFNASTNVRGHLADHWNVADSLFLHGAERPATKQAQEPEAPAADEDEDEQQDEGGVRLAGLRINPEPLGTLGQLLVDWAGRMLAILLGRMA